MATLSMPARAGSRFPDRLCRAVDRLQGIAQEVPVNDIWPGFVTTARSRREYQRAVKLVNAAMQLAERLIARETPRAEPYYQAFTLQEKCERAKQARGSKRDGA